MATRADKTDKSSDTQLGETVAGRIAESIGRFLLQFRRRGGRRMHSFQQTLRAGQVITAGRYILEIQDDGRICFFNGDGLAFFVRPIRQGVAMVQCFTDGRRMPIPAVPTAEEMDKTPLVSIGPSREYAVNWPPPMDNNTIGEGSSGIEMETPNAPAGA